MSHRNAKKIRKQIRAMGLDPKQTVYDTKKIPAFIQPKVNEDGILDFKNGEMRYMEVNTLQRDCGRAVYKQAKKTFWASR